MQMRPTPVKQYSVWPTGCACQAVRAPGVNDTTVARMRDGAWPTSTSSWNTSPAKLSAEPRRVGRTDARTTVIASSAFAPRTRAENTPRPGQCKAGGSRLCAARGRQYYSDPLEHRGDALADADAHRHQRVAAAGALQLPGGGQCDARSGGAEWMADRDRAAVHVDPAVVERQFEPAQAGQHLCRKGLVDLDDVDVGEAEAGAGQRLLRGGDRTDPHDPWRHARDAAADYPGERLSTRPVAGLAAGDDHRHGAVVDAGSVAGGRHPTLLQRPEARERRQIGLRPRMLVLGDLDRPRSAAWHLDRKDLALEEAVGLGRSIFALRGFGENIAGLARDLVVARQVVGGLRHRVGAELALDLRVREARADRRIIDAAVAAERGLGLVHDKRRAAHAFDTARDHDLALAAGDRLRCHDDRIEAAAAVALQNRAGDLDRQARQQPGVPPDAAAVFARLIGAANDDILDLFRVERALLDDLGDDRGEHVIGPHSRESAGVAAEGCALTVVQVSVEHDRLLPAASPPAGRLLSRSWFGLKLRASSSDQQFECYSQRFAGQPVSI